MKKSNKAANEVFHCETPIIIPHREITMPKRKTRVQSVTNASYSATATPTPPTTTSPQKQRETQISTTRRAERAAAQAYTTASKRVLELDPLSPLYEGAQKVLVEATELLLLARRALRDALFGVTVDDSLESMK